MNTLIALWRANGTKILGWFTAFIGATLAAESQIKAIWPQHALLYDLYANFASYLVMGTGAATIKRGYTNTRNSP